MAKAHLKLLFPHVPKTAGTTIRVAISKFYGAERIYEDYADGPPDPTGDLNIDPDGYCERNWYGGYPYLRNKDVAVGHFWAK